MIFDKLENLSLYWSLSPDFDDAIGALETMLASGEIPLGKGTVSDRVRYEVSECATKNREDGAFEAHRVYADIQIPLEGSERFLTGWTESMTEAVPYDAEKDICFLEGDAQGEIRLAPGSFVIVFPSDAHMPLIADGGSGTNKKIVFKVRVD